MQKLKTLPQKNQAGLIFALFGNPVAQSLSPRMHNRALRFMGIDGYYIPVLVKDLAGAVAAIRALDMRGVSVTIPFKEAIIPLLDKVDADALCIGSVNTVLNDGDTLTGFNTDWQGMEAALVRKMRIAGKRFVLIGSGGTTRAVAFAIKRNGGEIVVASRNRDRGTTLATKFGCAWIPLSAGEKIEGDVLINTTPVGMMPRVDALPVAKNIIHRFKYVVDAVYNPTNTRMLRVGKASGAVTISGVDMFVAQGAEQFRIWTGRKPPQRSMRATVLAALKDR
ncbi:MAG: shikimate dehydrogenase [Syntrophales bacterium]|jgi:shikimate dehydrogenase|nr:shikimate dehydrogenase [Syntrophales bacterium]